MVMPLTSLNPRRFETPEIFHALTAASRQLAELKGVVPTIPNRIILINTLSLQEAKDSSEIENIVTTHDELFRGPNSESDDLNPAAKEVHRYRQAMLHGYERVQASGLLTLRHILEIQERLEENNAGLRRTPGTKLKDSMGRVVYEPPQDPDLIQRAMGDLEVFINEEGAFQADPLVKMALIHHQFETIHPFYDGNGRTGRIINVLYLIKQGLLNSPVLYLSRYIVRSKRKYYELLQSTRTQGTWEEWVLYMLRGVEAMARDTIKTIGSIKAALDEYKHRIRDEFKFYSQDLINHLFKQVYTKSTHLMRELGVSRITATKYLNALADAGLLEKRKHGRSVYYVNIALVQVLVDG